MDLAKLRQIILFNKVSKQLETRAGIADIRVAQDLVMHCRNSENQEQFLINIASITPKLTLSNTFIISLYQTIKKNLGEKQKPPPQNNEEALKFPGLAIQNKQVKFRQDESRQASPQQDIDCKQKVKQQKKKKHRHRSRSRNKKKKKMDNKQHRSPQKIQLLQVQQGKIYPGIVTRVQQIGCFIQLNKVKGKRQGLVHISQISNKRITSPKDVIQKGQKVYVKVLAISGDKIRLSMKQVDQSSGVDITRKKKHKDVFTYDPNRKFGQLTGIKIQHHQQNPLFKKASSPERWQISRMKYMKGFNIHLPDSPLIQQDIEDHNIKTNDRQPPFLRGQTTKAGINLSPVRVVKNPQGTLQRQAINASQYARDRRQIRQQQQRQLTQNLHKDFSKYWQDPTAQPRLASQLMNQTAPIEWKKQAFIKRPQTKKTAQTIKDQQTSLPIYQYKNDLIQAVISNKVLIVIGQTGSGKTTQITQYLVQAGYTKSNKKIGCTQPRRVAAMSVAKRVAQEMAVTLGQQVGYSIRFQDYTSANTIIKYMTDGMLLRQALLDKDLNQYSVIMLDQAHQRTIHTDVLFGILKQVVAKRSDFTLIVTSATLEAQKFSSYFFNCKIFRIPGRTFPVDILYSKQPQTDYLDASLLCLMQIHLDEPSGDILLFLTGQQEIDTACQILHQRIKQMGPEIPDLIILPVYSALPSQLQTRIFQPAPPGKRKCVIATNIAQASLTIDGIYYVVDPGFAKIKIYNPKIGMDTLVVAPISQASAKQRAGRAGRTGPGKCYRLYTEHAYKNQMLPVTVPQIQRANLSNTVLQLKAMGINDLVNFDFMDSPPFQTLIAALEQLYYLGALDDEGLLTKLGRRMAQFPLQPPLSKMLLTSIDLGCSDEIITIISMLSVQNIFYRPKDKQGIADQRRAKFNHAQGDHLTYLTVFQAWKNNNYSTVWCHQNYIQARSMKRAQDVRKQLIGLIERYRFPIISCKTNYGLIRKSIVSGFFFHAAKKDPKQGFKTVVDTHQVYIHPSSSLFNKQPQWVVYHELVFTTKEYMRDVCAINPIWLVDVAPNFFSTSQQLVLQPKYKLEPLNPKYPGDSQNWRLSKRKG